MNYIFWGNAIRIQLIVVTLIFTYNTIHACTCEIKNSFINGIDESQAIVKIQILGHEELPMELINDELFRIKYPELYSIKEADSPPPPNDLISFTKLLVEEVYLGEIKGDTIGFYNGDGINCYSSLMNRPIGSRYIIKMWERADEYNSIDKLKPLKPFIFNHPMYNFTSCAIWKLDVEDETVKGYIESNHRFDLWVKAHYDETLSRLERDNLMEQMLRIKPEHFTIKKFRALVEEKKKLIQE